MVGSGDRVFCWPPLVCLVRVVVARVEWWGLLGLPGSEFFGVAGWGLGLVGWKSCPGDGCGLDGGNESAGESPGRGEYVVGVCSLRTR